MVYSDYAKLRILFYHQKGYKAPTIHQRLISEGIPCTRENIHRFLQRFEVSGGIHRKPGSGRPSSITTEIKAMVEEEMQRDDETTAIQLHELLVSRGYKISIRTVLRCRSSLGWTFRGSAYCQLIRDVNKQKRLAWAFVHQNDTFDDVIWSDECTVQMETHRRFCCRKKGEPPKPKPRYQCIYICTGYINICYSSVYIGLNIL